jgi:CBS domain containing-hemolysin-like protein
MAGGVSLILAAILLVLLNGFFVAAEFGLVKLRPTRVEAIAKKFGWRGRVLRRVHRDLDAYLSACQLGITLASLGLGWIGEPAFAQLLQPVLLAIGIDSERVLHIVAFTVAFSIISYLHIVVGELAPKSMAIRITDQVGIWTAVPLYAFYWLMYPAIWFLNTSSNWVLRKVGLDVARSHDSQYSAEELKLIFRTSSRTESDITTDESRVLAQALDFRDLEVSDLMRPFDEAVTLSAADEPRTNLDRIARHRFTRYPYLDAEGHLRGIVHVKDLLLAQRDDAPFENFAELVRPATIVPPTMAASELFRRFRQGATHFAVIAVDEGNPLGFVTLDNLLGALVGEISDEFRQSEAQWSKAADGTVTGKGSLPVFTLGRVLGVEIVDPGVDSVGGLIYQRLGDVPREGQRVEFDRFDVVVTKMKGPRIVNVRVIPREEQGA